MATELRWLVSFSASCFHTAAALIAGRRLVEVHWAEAMGEAVEGLRREIASVGLPSNVTEHLCGLSAGIENNRELAKVTLTKTLGRRAIGNDRVTALSRVLTNVETAYRQARPNVVDELSQRAAPLMAQWEARGPGMLAKIARLTEPDLLVERADVILVFPVLGGGGAAHLPYNSVRIEAVLADPHDDLPEAVRLAWLLSSLNLDLPKYGDHLPGGRQSTVGALAMLPAVLTAGADVELTQLDRSTIQTAIRLWLPEDGLSENVAETLVDWWATYQASRPAWAVALGALDRMLF